MNIFGRLFTRKYSISDARILEGMTDVHAHLLPGVDDGVSDIVSAKKAIAYLEQLGVLRIFLTPHIMSDLRNNTSEFLSACFKDFSDRLFSSISVRLGAEYMLDASFRSHLERGLLTYDGQHVLLETSYIAPPLGLNELLKEVMKKGYIPIIAHPERYVYMNFSDYDKLKEMGCLFQLNLMSLGGCYGEHALYFSALLLEKGLYTYLGSDFHCISPYKKMLNRKILTNKQIEILNDLLCHNEILWNYDTIR